MLMITVQVNAAPGKAIGIKEDLAMFLEQYGDARVVSVEEAPQRQMEQMMIGGGVYHEQQKKRVSRVRR